MKKVSEILKRVELNTSGKPPTTQTRTCANCETKYEAALEHSAITGRVVVKGYLCPECVAVLKQAGPYAEFRSCRRCNTKFVCSDRWEQDEFCIKCRPIVEREVRDARRKERIEKWKEICPPLYLNSDPARLPKLAEVLAWQYNEHGLLLHGETGKGKTRCAWQLLRRLYVEENIRNLIAFDSTSFSHSIAKHFGPDGDGEKWATKIVGAQILFFDDLGKARLTERGQSELFGIIENRMAYQTPTIITTNFVGDTLASCFRDDVGKALVRRLRECCHAIGFC